jgi:hypothetical protein
MKGPKIMGCVVAAFIWHRLDRKLEGYRAIHLDLDPVDLFQR